jgi:hypothetical protein
MHTISAMRTHNEIPSSSTLIGHAKNLDFFILALTHRSIQHMNQKSCPMLCSKSNQNYQNPKILGILAMWICEVIL